MDDILSRETKNLQSNTPVAPVSEPWTCLQETLSGLISKINEELDSTLTSGICELECQAKWYRQRNSPSVPHASPTSFCNPLPPPGKPFSPPTFNQSNYPTFAMSHSSPWPKCLRLGKNNIVRFHKCVMITQTKRRHSVTGKQSLSKKLILKFGSSQITG